VKLAPFSRRAHEAIEIPLGHAAVAGPAKLDAIDVQHVRNR
jgi:hypothetical protein